jgi:hypothetical protein
MHFQVHVHGMHFQVHVHALLGLQAYVRGTHFQVSVAILCQDREGMEAWPQPFLRVHQAMQRSTVLKTEAAELKMATRLMADKQLLCVTAARELMETAEATATKARAHWQQTRVQYNWLEVMAAHAKEIADREALQPQPTRTRSRSRSCGKGRRNVGK